METGLLVPILLVSKGAVEPLLAGSPPLDAVPVSELTLSNSCISACTVILAPAGACTSVFSLVIINSVSTGGLVMLCLGVTSGERLSSVSAWNSELPSFPFSCASFGGRDLFLWLWETAGELSGGERELIGDDFFVTALLGCSRGLYCCLGNGGFFILSIVFSLLLQFVSGSYLGGDPSLRNVGRDVELFFGAVLRFLLGEGINPSFSSWASPILERDITLSRLEAGLGRVLLSTVVRDRSKVLVL